MHIDFLIDVFKRNMEKPAVIYRNMEYSYEMLLGEFNKWKDYLEDKGVKDNATVSVIADFNPASIGLILALIEKGCIILPISPDVKNPERLLEIAEAEYLIRLDADDPAIERRDINAGHEYLVRLKNDKNPGLVLFSSGITGEPKGAVHNLSLLLDKFKKPGKILRTITFLMFDHIGGFNTLFHVLSNAGTVVVTEDRTPDGVLGLIERYKVELLPTTPTFINMILFSRAYTRYDLSSLKIVSYGTEPMSEATLKSFSALFPGIMLKQTYGLSEIGIMSTKSEGSDSLWLKVGGDGYETRIVDGKLWIKARSAMLGYLNAPSPFTEDGWFNTRDCVETKGEYIRFLGRDSDIINVGGEKVYPVEIESTILEVEGVKEAAVHGEANPILGRIVVAEVSISEGLDRKEYTLKIKKHCQSKLEKFKVPVKINFHETIPSNYRFKKLR
jgi:long-chain acyl-CoA synthetase